MVSMALGSMSYLDSGASFHMTRDKKKLSELEEKDLQIHIEMGNDVWCIDTDIETINFQRDSGKPFQLKYVMHV